MAAPVTYPGIAPSGDTRCPVWCDPALCCPEVCHRSEAIEVDTTEAVISLSLRQWRADDELLAPGWAPAHLSYHITHKTELAEEGYGPDAPLIVSRSEPVALSVHHGVTVADLPRLIDAQQRLLALLRRDGGAGHG